MKKFAKIGFFIKLSASLLFLAFFLPEASAIAGSNYISEEIRYNGQSVRLDVYNPYRASSPVVILIHGAAGIEGDRAERYDTFATELSQKGMIAINVHYFHSPRNLWKRTITEAISYAETIPNANSSLIALVGYSLGGTIALQVASSDERVSHLVIQSGYLPRGFTKEDASLLPPTYICAGTEDTAIETLRQLDSWLSSLGIPIETRINHGYGHTMPMTLFWENWREIVRYLQRSFGFRPT